MRRPLAAGESETSKTYVKFATGFAEDAEFWFKVAQRVIVIAGVQYASTRATAGSNTQVALVMASIYLRLILTLWLSTAACARFYPIIRYALERIHVSGAWQKIGILSVLGIGCVAAFWYADGFMIRTLNDLIEGMTVKPK